MNFNLFKIPEKFILNKLNLIKNGTLDLKNYNNDNFSFGKTDKEIVADIKINTPKFYFNILKGGSTGLAECYVRDEFSTSNLTSLIELTARNIDLTHRFSGILNIRFLKNLFRNFFYSNTRSKSKEYISKHYDLGNEFFSIWLDKTLTYSSAIYNKPNDDLANAQLNKYNKLIDIIKPKSGDKVLEIGCGWGGFAEHLAKNHDIKLDCITISKKQLDFTKKRIFNAGLNEKVEIKFLDYRDLKGKYDSLDERYLKTLLVACHECVHVGYGKKLHDEEFSSLFEDTTTKVLLSIDKREIWSRVESSKL